MIITSCLNRYLPHTFHDLNMCQGSFYLLTHSYCILYFSHVAPVSVLCSSGGLIMFFSYSPYTFLISFLKDTFLFPHIHQVYIVVDTILYPYVLPIDHSLLSYSSLCLSCKVSQVQDYNNIRNWFSTRLDTYHDNLYEYISIITSTIRFFSKSNKL